MPELPRAVVVSASPGRLRLRLPAHRDDAAFFAQLSPRALMLPGVTAASANPLTAGLLLRFRGAADAVLAAAARDRLFSASMQPVASAARTVSPARLAPLAVSVLGLAALIQAARGAVLPPTVTLLWYAGSLLRALPSHQAEE